jgi:hypothetical protein
MSVKYRAEGTGFTLREVLQTDLKTADDMAETLAFTSQRSRGLKSFPDRLDEIASGATKDLRKIGIPAWQVQSENGVWIPLKDKRCKPGIRYATAEAIVRERGHPHDSVFGYAARVLGLVSRIKNAITKGDAREAAELSFRLGDLKYEAWDKLNRGSRSRSGGRARKGFKNEQYVAMADELVRLWPNSSCSRTELMKRIGGKFGLRKTQAIAAIKAGLELKGTSLEKLSGELSKPHAR